MKQILKILKKSWLAIVITIGLLFLQANLDLALPDYTARIINVGIQQNGIESNVLEVVRESELEKIFILSDLAEKQYILKNYNKITKENKEYLNKYPLLKEENLYVLKNKNNLKKLEEIFTDKLMLLFVFTNDEVNYMLGDNLPIHTDTDLFTNLSHMSEESKNHIINQVLNKMDNLTDSMKYQMTIQLVKNEYQIIGVNTQNLQTTYIARLGIQMILLSFGIMIVMIITTYLSSRIGANFSRELRSKVVGKVMCYSNQEFEKISTSSLITRSTNDITQVQILIIMILRIVIYAPILGFGALNKVSTSPLAWIIGIAVLTILTLVVTLLTISLPKFRKLQKLVDRVNLVTREILTGIPVIRAFANEKYEEKKFDNANKDLTKVNLFVNKIMTIMMPTMLLIMYTIQILIVWIGAKNMDLGNIQIGDLLAFITYTMQIIMSFLMISMVSIILPRSWASIKRIAEVFNLEPSVKDKKDVKKFDKNTKGIVEFKEVYFRYPDANEDVLENISFKSLPGTTTAFIGSTGSGKSTLINLIPRFFDTTGGKITIDGIDIKDVSLHELRKSIGFVPQKGVLFSGTIESNINFGKKNTKKEMEEVAKIAQAEEFILSKELKYKTEIAQGGSNVSGGQKQRLAIARAIAVKPKIYIFDDSFSALDYKTDTNLRKQLKKYTKDSTIFIVAQRINTILNADQIIVLDEGKIVGVGKHEELLKKCSIYREIAESQLSKEEL